MFLFTLSFCFLSVSILEVINSLDHFIKDPPEDFTTEINNVVVLKNLKIKLNLFIKIAKNKLHWIIGWRFNFHDIDIR